MKKKTVPLWGLLIAIGLLIGLIPVGTTLADDTTYGIWVEGKEVTSANANDILAGEGKGKVSYDITSKTLTLENANLGNAVINGNELGETISYYTAIYAQKEMTIKLIGENTMTTDKFADPKAYKYGLFLKEGGQIIGEGSLTITGENNESGICSKNELTIGGKATINVNCRPPYGISSGILAKSLTIRDQAEVNTQAIGQDGYGLSVDNDADIVIKDTAKVIASGNANGLREAPDLSKYITPYIEVSNKADGSDLASWDGNTPLGGKKSPYQYVKIGQGLYAITFDANDGKASTPKTLGTDTTGKLTAFPAAPTREGHHFHSWNTAADGSGRTIKSGDIFTANTTLYAQWTNDIEVTFDLNYQGAAKASKAKAGQDGKLATLPTTTRAGYTFLGWFDNKEGNGLKITTDKIFKNNEVLYAKWAKAGEANGPEVTFDLNYQGAAQASKAKAGQDGKFTTLPTPIRTGYTFLGWFDNKEGKGLKITTDKIFKNSEVLYAKWQKGTGKENIQVTMIINSLDYFVNGQKKTMDAEPLIRQSRTFVPYRALTEAFGAKVDWDGNKRTVTVNLGDKTIVMTIDKKTYSVNGVEKTMDVAPYIEKSRTMIPVRFAGEGLGFKVTPSYHTDGTTASVQFEN